MLNLYPFIIIWAMMAFLLCQIFFDRMERNGHISQISFRYKVLGACIITCAIAATIVVAWFLTGLVFGYK